MKHPTVTPTSVEPARTPGFWRSRNALGLVFMGTIAGYFLLTEHLAHTLGALPYLLLAACPLMHLFMHHGHGEHHHPAGNEKSEPPAKPTQADDAS